ncbi:MAG TPA: Asp23/Gls24 family envelope stress response protein [Candidatus Limnocylindrales bacterium]|nr:Asp23/Gls24 family envelope stress response protein [Candidatus Limnocylindrales bacterium]
MTRRRTDKEEPVELVEDDELPDDAAMSSGPASVELAADLSVGRGVIVEVARLAALEVPDVLRVARRGPRWRAALAGPPITVRVRSDGVLVRLRIIARPGADLAVTGRRVREAVGRAVERLLGLEVREVSVLVDGVGT